MRIRGGMSTVHGYGSVGKETCFLREYVEAWWRLECGFFSRGEEPESELDEARLGRNESDSRLWDSSAASISDWTDRVFAVSASWLSGSSWGTGIS
jgi:hypothetical protein